MSAENPFELEDFRPVISGTGLIALDLVLPNEPHSLPQLWAGGTCGNVLTALAYLGWDAYPIARLRADAASRQILQDLGRWRVRADFLELTETGSTPVIVQHIHCSPGRGKTHSFSRRCPFCGAMLPWYKPLRIVDSARIVPQLPPAATFFFDRVSPGAIRLARHAAESGSLVVFEPSASSDSHRLDDALSVAHVVKYSIDRLEGLGDLRRGEGPRLIIETRGGEGLRFLSRPDEEGEEWQVSEPFPASRVIDTSGCGDWCTAGIIHMLGRHGAERFLEATPGRIREAIRFGQALASWNCGFEGARGGMYRSDKEHTIEYVRSLLSGEPSQPDLVEISLVDSEAAGEYACASCGERSVLP